MSNGNGRLVTPVSRIHVADVTKRQLARAFNEQAERLKALRNEHQKMSALLIAITLEPEAFQYLDGVRIDRAAVEKVRSGTQLRVEYVEGFIVLNAVSPEDAPKVIDAPKIVLPPR